MKGNKTIRRIFALMLILTAWIMGEGTAHAATAQATEDKFTLVIDAGHGGRDPGAIGRFSREKNINLSIAKAFGKLVEQHCPDVKVIYTRKNDVFVPLGRRAEIANNAHADLFVSIHTNALPGKAIGRGAETYTLGMARADENLEVAKRENSVILVEEDYQERYEGFDPKSSESYIIFELMQDQHMAQSVEFAQMVQKEFRTTGGRNDKGVHQAGFLVLRETSMPSVLIELGYISTHDEEAFLNSQNGIRKMSQSIYNAFVAYKQKHIKSGHTEAQPDETTAIESAAESDIALLTGEEQVEEKHKQSVPKPAKDAQTEEENRPVFKVQLIATARQIPTGSTRFKGLSPISFYKEGAYYKYTYGETTVYQEAIKMRNRIKANFKDAFIVAFKGGEKMPLNEAITESKKKQ